ncbi:MAG: aldo/keto reductase [Oscillospiraceae bacterium]|nr:aldo/keto reductase [Oscillospiraceae bacterium]
MNKFFPEIKKNFGFGCMRLPLKDEQIDEAAFCAMIDKFIAAGFNYFDTARPYHGGMSEKMIKTCLAQRHDRSEFLLANKLSGSCFETEQQIRPLIDDQLATCGVEYFDFYLMHAMSAARHQKCLDTHAYDIAQEYKRAGKLRHVGMSFHDSAEVLDKILTDRPELEFVQLQFNYLDYNDPKVQSRLCYEVCRKHNKPVLVMEPVKGGTLVNLPAEALELLPDGSPASYAIRYAAGFDGIVMVLSGMSNMEQLEDNISYMADFKPLSEKEHEAIDKVRTLYQAQHKIPCTACRYCVDGCPAGIPIPEIFALQNAKLGGEAYDAAAYGAFSANATDCVECGQCETSCPQSLQIRDLLKEVHKVFG